MRIVQSIFVGSITVLAALALASPASANSSSLNSHANANAKADDTKVDDEPAPAGCRAYQKGPDGSWVELACHEGNESASAPVRSKSASHSSGETAR